MKRLFLSLFLSTTIFTSVAAAEPIHLTGSSTVLPYAKIAAETFHEVYPEYDTPIVEGGGTGAGIKEFCKGIDGVDIVNASRPMKESEVQACIKNGVTLIQGYPFGPDGKLVEYGLVPNQQ